MSSFCQESEDGDWETQDATEEYLLWISIGSSALIFLLTLTTSYIIFFRREKDQRPMVVMVQLGMLVGFCICYVVFNFLVLHSINDCPGDGNGCRPWFANLLGTIENLFLLLYDWLFIEQYLSASLMLPVALEGGKKSESA